MPELGGERRADPRRQHDAGEERSQLARESDRDQARDQPFHAEAFQLISGQEGHGQPEKKRDHGYQRHRADAGALGVPKETRRAKGSTAAPHVLHRFGEGVDDEPEHAPHFAQEIAALVADSLHDEDRDWSESSRWNRHPRCLVRPWSRGSCPSSMACKGKIRESSCSRPSPANESFAARESVKRK